MEENRIGVRRNNKRPPLDLTEIDRAMENIPPDTSFDKWAHRRRTITVLSNFLKWPFMDGAAALENQFKGTASFDRYACMWLRELMGREGYNNTTFFRPRFYPQPAEDLVHLALVDLSTAMQADGITPTFADLYDLRMWLKESQAMCELELKLQF